MSHQGCLDGMSTPPARSPSTPARRLFYHFTHLSLTGAQPGLIGLDMTDAVFQTNDRAAKKGTTLLEPIFLHEGSPVRICRSRKRKHSEFLTAIFSYKKRNATPSCCLVSSHLTPTSSCVPSVFLSYKLPLSSVDSSLSQVRLSLSVLRYLPPTLHTLRTPAMNNTIAPAGPAPIASSPPFTLEIIIGLLALILALAGVVVGVAQYLQARAARRRQPDPESGVELSIIQRSLSNTLSVGSDYR
jgi:hypothetical protein